MPQICGCPESIPDWDQQNIDLSGQPVHEQKFPALLHMPLAYELYAKKQENAVNALGLTEPWPGFTLTRTSVFGGKLLRLIDSSSSPSHQVKRLASPFMVYAQLHQGNLGTARSTIRAMQSRLLDNAKLPKGLFIAHLTCPRCEANKGGEKLLLVRHWVESRRLSNKVAKQ